MIITLFLLTVTKIDLYTNHEGACVRIATPTIVDTWVNTTQIDFWVETLVARDSEKVVSCTIEGKILNPIVETVAECVAQRERLQTDIRTLLDPTV
jgi:hypothetical protein